MKVSFTAAFLLLLPGVTQARVDARFTNNVHCMGWQNAETHRVGSDACLSGLGGSQSVKISKITKKEREICMRKFRQDGCMDEAEPQQLTIAKSDNPPCVIIDGDYLSFMFGEDVC